MRSILTKVDFLGELMSNLRVKNFSDEEIRRLFGAQAAEDERPEQLKSYFVKNDAYQRLTSNIPLRIVVGHKGVGKSALLKIAHLEDKEQNIVSVWLRPNDISKAWNVQGGFVEKVEAIKENLLQIIHDAIINSVSIGGTATGERPILKNARHLFLNIEKYFGTNVILGVEKAITDSFATKKIIRVYIDDIDRGWAATKGEVQNISALINAARDLTNDDQNLQFRIGIRSDAYSLVRSNDESGDKIEPYIIPLHWTNHDILVMMAKRVALYFGQEVNETELAKKGQVAISLLLSPIIVDKFDGKGHWANRPIHNVLLSLTRQRPRDLIKLLTGAALNCEKEKLNRIETRHLTDSFPEYSGGRIEDLKSEFKSEMQSIDRVLYGMKPTAKETKEKQKPFLYKTDELIAKLSSIAKNHSISFCNGSPATGISLAQFLFKIDFIVARKDGIEIERLYNSNHSNLLSSHSDFGFQWEVHPAYRWALNPVDVNELIKTIDV
jgi:hypothetical protein